MNPTRIDSLIGIISPAWMSARLAAREQRTKLSYEAARSGRERPPPQPLRGPDNIIHQLESVAMIQRAEELARDSSFIKSIIDRFKMHVVGNLQYIPQVGTRKENALYREFWQKWAKKSDVTRRFHFVDQMNMGVSGCLVQGDHGIIHHHHPDGTFQIQNVEGENIGNPRQVVSGNNHVIRGVVIDANGAPVAYRIYKQTVNSQFIFVDEVPASHFSHLNPVTRSDEYKAKTPFHAVLNDAADFRRIEKAWLNKIQWAGFKVGQINTANGMAPQPSTNYLDEPSNSVTRGRLQPMAAGEVLYGEPGMEVKMIEGKTPSPQEMDFMIVKLQQIAGALNLPLPFVYVMMGLPGTYTRLIGEWASRTFEDGPIGQRWLQRTALDEIKNKALLSGIMRDEIPYVKNWDKGQWMFPARSSVDVGRESDANLKENAQGIRSMADICAEEGRYWDDVDQELEYEAESKMERAIRTAQRIKDSTGVAMTWQDVMPHIQMMGPNPTPKDQPEEAQKKSEPVDSKLASLSDRLDDLRTRLDEKWDEGKHPRAKDGEFGPGGGGRDPAKKDTKTASRTPAKATPNKTAVPALSEKSQRAKAAHVMVDKHIQRYAEEHNEPRMAKSLGGVSFPDGEPIDIAIAGPNGVVKHGIELKTVVANSNGKITMKGDAIARKKSWERKNKATIHTVVIDDSAVFNAKGEGKHDESKRKIYYRRGYGSFRFNGMHQVKDVAELKSLFDTPTRKLPPGAR